MRLWHKDLIPVLPDKWLVAQWRELSAISGKLIKHGSPQHALVNKITDYEWQHFAEYVYQVYLELKKRGKRIKEAVYEKILSESKRAFDRFNHIQHKYENWEKLFMLGTTIDTLNNVCITYKKNTIVDY